MHDPPRFGITAASGLGASGNKKFDAFGKLYAMNARPMQPVNGRVIKASN